MFGAVYLGFVIGNLVLNTAFRTAYSLIQSRHRPEHELVEQRYGESHVAVRRAVNHSFGLKHNAWCVSCRLYLCLTIYI